MPLQDIKKPPTWTKNYELEACSKEDEHFWKWAWISWGNYWYFSTLYLPNLGRKLFFLLNWHLLMLSKLEDEFWLVQYHDYCLRILTVIRLIGNCIRCHVQKWKWFWASFMWLFLVQPFEWIKISSMAHADQRRWGLVCLHLSKSRKTHFYFPQMLKLSVAKVLVSFGFK